MALPVIRALLEHDADAEDARMPLLVWWAIESKLGEDADSTLAMFRDSAVWEMPLVKQHLLERVMRRFASTDQRKQYVYCAQLLQMAPSPDHVQRLMSGFEKAFQGRSLAGLPDELVAAMAASGGTSLALKVRQGDSQAIAEALRLIEDDTTDRETRQSYIEIFGQVRHQQSVPVLLKLIAESGDDPLRSAALSALSIYTDPQIGDEVVGRYVGFPPEVRGVAETLLASRRDWARKLLLAIDAGDIEAQRVPMPVVRKILFHDDPAIAELVKRHWGGVQGATTQQMRQRIDHLSQAILEGSGNPYQGKVLFAEHCGKCHKLFAQGGEIGPDLTVYQRTDLRRMLVNVVNPSAEIREGFENYLIITDSGRTLTGFIADRDNRVVVLKGIDGRSITIPRDEIDEMAAVARSVMPEGVLDPLSEQQIRDLFAYLRCEQPLP
jgi:putative heme-binding domain-containing protein